MSLSYTITPFHPTISYTGQVQTELNLANANFTTLAQAFLNQDPTSLTVLNAVNSLRVGGYGVSATPIPNTLLPLNSSGQFPASVIPSSGYSNPVDLSSATTDYLLKVGEVAYIRFTNVSSFPLHIATMDGTYYEMHLVSNNTSGYGNPIYLNPNNTSYWNSFYYTGYRVWVWGWTVDYYVYNSFRIGWGVPVSTVFISNHRTLKTVRGLNGEYYWGTDEVSFCGSIWNDTTTSWTSLGTITFPQATSGYVLVRRLA
jgi:hypothetical protein